MKKGTLFILSAISGGGKTTLRKHVFSVFPNDLIFSISATTRAIRHDEQEGKDYFFISKDEFEKKIKENAFLEYAVVHGGSSAKYYGTFRRQIEDAVNAGKSVVCVIDVQGFEQIKKNYDGKIVSIFIKTPTLEEARQRLIKRGENTLQQIEERMKTAEIELKKAPLYDHILINDDLDIAKKEIENIFRENM